MFIRQMCKNSIVPVIQEPLFPDPPPTQEDIMDAWKRIPEFVRELKGVCNFMSTDSADNTNHLDGVYQDLFYDLIENVMSVLHPDIVKKYEVEEGFYDDMLVDRFLELYDN